ncbi:helicase-related protein [Agrococcus sp. 1P02AA]|uniref:helicase-related protein n=1 Tax=Agrococcus sp. 1P02AA TaxID=3132259 RepID=UPI0039A66E9E
MTALTAQQQAALEHLRSAYVGPEAGPKELLRSRPDLHYIVGHLFPEETAASDTVQDGTLEFDGIENDDVDVAGLRPKDWRPSSIAVSFVTDASILNVQVDAATYSAEEQDDTASWRRSPWSRSVEGLARDATSRELDVNGRRARIDTVWRPHPSGSMVTVALRNLENESDTQREIVEKMLFQVALAIDPADGSIVEYVRIADRLRSEEAEELALRFRAKRLFAVGHGVAVDWTADGETCSQVRTSHLPYSIVRAIQTTSFAEDDPRSEALSLARLVEITDDSEGVLNALHRFVDAYDAWRAAVDVRVEGLEERWRPAAGRIRDRAEQASLRMRGGIAALEDPSVALAFSMAMEAMQLQMRQASAAAGVADAPAPAWRPFQLGFLLSALASTVDDTHSDREVVDLIWFPTGGGKTEAYLGLAAVELLLRRIRYGVEGGGTAVITRYTMRLLTSQQFQRTALLVCALEVLRTSPGGRLAGMAPFSIGLWVGNETTPGTRKAAIERLKDLKKVDDPRESNPFQVEACPWCSAQLLPEKRSQRDDDYGPVVRGSRVLLTCTRPACEFFDGLPLEVVDEDIFATPPTIVLATVDKFARLQFSAAASRILGIDTVFRQPSLVIQDELHLLSGPLGTTVGVFEAALLALLELKGSRPKIVASTATIRAAAEQAAGLYARPVSLYPPSGIDEDESFFSELNPSGGGRLYIGLMPVSLPQATSLISTFAPMFELPMVSGSASAPYDAFWTLVAYHNSLRELGRSSNHIVDDVSARLESRSEENGIRLRSVRADGLIELTSRKKPGELTRDLRRLATAAGDGHAAVDAVVSSNMLSVGIDVSRLGLMLMVGQPKTTAEYIQATSRVGRGRERGVVVTLFRSNRPRDRSHFETFRSYHEAIYRAVEPTSVTPWALNSRQRSLAGAYVMLLRHAIAALRADSDAVRFDLDKPSIGQAAASLAERLLVRIKFADRHEHEAARSQLELIRQEWDDRARAQRAASAALRYERLKDDEGLYKRFGQSGPGFIVMDSMRSVDANVPIEVREPGGRFDEAD